MEQKIEEVTQDAQTNDDTEMQAAFAASFGSGAESAVETPAIAEVAEKVEAKVEEKPQEKATPEAPPATVFSEDQVKLLSGVQKLEQLLQRVDKVDGNYGEIKRLLEATQKAAATPKGAAEFEASEDGNKFDKEFPELANGVRAEIKQAISTIQPGITTEQFEAMYQQRREKEDIQKRDELIGVLHKAHPDRFDIQKTPQWTSWVESLPGYQRESLTNSEDPYYVSGMLSKFKDYRAKQELAEKKSKNRIENAVTPNGVRPSSPSTITEDEAMQQAFASQFK